MKSLTICVIILVLAPTLIVTNPLDAAGFTDIECGDVIESQFANDTESHDYSINIEEDTRLIAIAEVDPRYQRDMSVVLEILAENGREMTRSTWGDVVEHTTDPVPESGTYEIHVESLGDFGGRYKLYTACVEEDGHVISGHRYVQEVECGSIVNSNFLVEDAIEKHFYYISLSENDTLQATAEVNKGYERDLSVVMEILAENGREMTRSYFGDLLEYETDPVPESGVYEIQVESIGDFGGRYSLYVGCLLGNGTNIEPGEGSLIDMTE